MDPDVIHLKDAKRPGAIVRRVSDAISALANTAPVVVAIVIICLIALGWVGIYVGGGTRYVSTQWFYIPILLAAIRFGLKTAVGTALVSAFVAGPLLPLDATRGLQQSMSSETTHAVYFVLIGVLMAATIWRLEDSLSKETQLAEHEAELSEHEAELTAQQSAVVSTLSHEFRSPLSILLATSEMLEGVEWSGFEATVVEGITSSARRLNALITAVLAVSEGPLAVEPAVREVPLREIVSFVREGLELSMRERVKIDVSDLVLSTNPAILQGLLRQLMDNALKFSPEHSPVEISAWGSKGDNLFIDISDRGCGIDEAFLPQAFEAFTRQDQSMTRSVGGLGMGLFIAHRLAESLHAEVGLHPRAGGGTEALVTMPGSVLAPFPEDSLAPYDELLACQIA
jgi:signal transduction histidine kinase